MGCSSSLPQLEEDQEILLKKSFHYSDDDISHLFTAFRKIDITKSRFVDYDEFCMRCKCEPTPFLESIFSFFSSSGGKHPSQSFAEFSFFISFFLTLDETGLASYLYKVLTDKKHNPGLSKKELRTLPVLEETILEMFGKTWGKRDKLHVVLRKMDLDHSGSVSEAEFIQNCLKNKSLLFPTVRYQLDLRGRILSHPFWTKREGMGNKLLHDILKTRDGLHRVSSSKSTAPTELSSLSKAMAHSVKDSESKGHGNNSLH